MATEILINVGWGNGLLPHDTKQLPEPMLTPSLEIFGIHLPAIIQEALKISIYRMGLKSIRSELPADLPEANQLIFH